MLYDVSTFLFLLAIAAADTNTHQRFKSTPKPAILFESPLMNPPTHISEFTDPNTGLNPFLDLEEGPTFIGRNNIMKDETRQDPPFMDFNIMEGDGSNRQWLNSNVPKEESISRWVPFEAEVKMEDFNFQTTAQTYTTETDQMISTLSTISDYEKVHEDEVYDTKQNVTEELQFSVFSNATAIYVAVAIAILIIIIIILGGCWWRKKLRSRTTRSRTMMENGELKC